MILLDTNHLTLLQIAGGERYARLILRIARSTENLAAIALANDALLLTANRRDFEQIPGLRFDGD